MSRIGITVGQVVESVAGRDAGRYFLVMSLGPDGFCRIVDGRAHKQSKPKLKRIKHIRPTELVIESIRDKWLAGAKVFDSEIASSLKQFNFKSKKGEIYAQE